MIVCKINSKFFKSSKHPSMKYYFTIIFTLMVLNTCNLFRQPQKIIQMGNSTNSQKIKNLEMTNTLKEKVVESLIQNIHDYYVFPEQVKGIKNFLQEKLKEELNYLLHMFVVGILMYKTKR